MSQISRKRIQAALRAASLTRKETFISDLLSGVQDVFSTLNCRESNQALRDFREDPCSVLKRTAPDPKEYDCARSFGRAWQTYHLLRKAPAGLLKTGLDLPSIAIGGFHKIESRMLSVEKELATPCVDFPRDSIIMIARRKIAQLLPTLTAESLLTNLCLSSGASTRLRKKDGNPAFKLCGHMHVTSDVEPLLRALLWEDEVFSKGLRDVGPVSQSAVKLTVVPGSRLTTVPKNAKTDRTIAIEPEGNMLIQKAVARLIRKSLKKVDIDLDSQLLNQELARYGSFTGCLATLDLEAASDTLSVAIIRELLPPDWFNLLDRIRSKCYTEDDGKTYTPFVKFSTMGNGFTFELESLVFFALSWATARYYGSDGYVGVFGDDIIVETSVVTQVAQMLELCGFKINLEKSFIDGPFRESCGKHYFLGHDVTPFMLTKLRWDVTDYVMLLNKLRDWQRRMGFPETKKLKSFDLSWVPSTPPSFGYRAGIIDHDSDYRHQTLINQRKSFHSFFFLSYSSSMRRVPDFGNYAYKMMSHNFTASAEEGFVAVSGELVVRKGNQVSVWN